MKTGNDRADQAMDDLTNGGTTLPSGNHLTRVINNTNPNLECPDTVITKPSKTGIHIIKRREWGALPFKKDGSFKCMDYMSLLKPELKGAKTREQKLKKIYQGGRIVVHHSAAATGGKSTVKGIQKYHLDTKYQDVKYHFLIDKNGMIYEGRKLEVMGAHAGAIPKDSYTCDNKNKVQNVADDYDFKAIGIMLTGNFEVKKPSDKQFSALKGLINNLKSRFSVTKVSPHQHVRKAGPTDCPGLELLSNMSKEMGLKFSAKPMSKLNDIKFRELKCVAPSVSCK